MEPAVAHEAHDPLNDTPPCQMADNGLCQWHCQSVNGLPLLPEIQQESSRNSRIDRPYINGNGDKRAELTPRVTLNPSRSGFTIHVHA